MKLFPLFLTTVVSKRIVINTWPFVEANEAAWNVISEGLLNQVLQIFSPYKNFKAFKQEKNLAFRRERLGCNYCWNK